MKTNIVEKIQEIRNSGFINRRYQLGIGELREIVDYRHQEWFGVALDVFAYGYAQGHKAAVAEAKRKKVSE